MVSSILGDRIHVGWSIAILAIVVCVVLMAAPPGQSKSASTRLVSGPVIFRLAGYQHLPDSSGRKLWRYLMVFRLNRNPGPRSHRDEDPGLTRYGNFSVQGTDIAVDDLFQRASPSQCIAFTPVQFDRWQPLLGKVKIGRRVKVELRPYAGSGDDAHRLGRTYVVRPTLHRADAGLMDSTARRELQRIGCRGPLKSYGR